MDIKIDLSTLHITGRAECVGGYSPEPPIAHYPHLVWAPLQHGPGIWTEDGRASVEQICAELALMPSYDQLAAHFGTTPAHVAEAVDYAIKAKYLS